MGQTGQGANGGKVVQFGQDKPGQSGHIVAALCVGMYAFMYET